ncbi:unnamed protein product [Pleuronectes platessa]|uniref:Uncharacterized protein n=1 Tax=Pleuronectes platessa TaxID=8262 RepID=A0A9N7Z783_PLEPL|nr:unnamed protein product [Pleuronectes platessa]
MDRGRDGGQSPVVWEWSSALHRGWWSPAPPPTHPTPLTSSPDSPPAPFWMQLQDVDEAEVDGCMAGGTKWQCSHRRRRGQRSEWTSGSEVKQVHLWLGRVGSHTTVIGVTGRQGTRELSCSITLCSGTELEPEQLSTVGSQTGFLTEAALSCPQPIHHSSSSTDLMSAACARDDGAHSLLGRQLLFITSRAAPLHHVPSCSSSSRPELLLFITSRAAPLHHVPSCSSSSRPELLLFITS